MNRICLALSFIMIGSPSLTWAKNPPPPSGADILSSDWSCETLIRKLGIDGDSGKYWVLGDFSDLTRERMVSLRGKRVRVVKLEVTPRQVPLQRNYEYFWTTFASVYAPNHHLTQVPLVGAWHVYHHNTPMKMEVEPTPAYEDGTPVAFKDAKGNRYQLYRTEESKEVIGRIQRLGAAGPIRLSLLDDNDQIQNVSVGTEGSGFRTLIQVLD